MPPRLTGGFNFINKEMGYRLYKFPTLTITPPLTNRGNQCNDLLFLLTLCSFYLLTNYSLSMFKLHWLFGLLSQRTRNKMKSIHKHQILHDLERPTKSYAHDMLRFSTYNALGNTSLIQHGMRN